MMPGKTGYVVCEELKSDPATKNIFVMFMTARGSPLVQRTASERGGDAFMPKPFEPADLRARVRKALNIK